MRSRFVMSVLWGFALGLSALTDFPAQAADTVAAGKEKAEMCAGCHGDNGISQTENIPSLAGQPDQFIQWQLVFFRCRRRKNEQMQPIVEQINNEDIRNLGAYFASLTPPKAPARRQSRSIQERRAGRRGTALRVMPYRFICGNQSRGPPRRPARGISASRRCTTTSQACDPAAAWRRWLMSPIPSAKRRSPRSRIISRISELPGPRCVMSRARHTDRAPHPRCFS